MCSLQARTSPGRLAAFPPVPDALDSSQSVQGTELWLDLAYLELVSTNQTCPPVGSYHPRGQAKLMALKGSLNEKDSVLHIELLTYAAGPTSPEYLVNFPFLPIPSLPPSIKTSHVLRILE